MSEFVGGYSDWQRQAQNKPRVAAQNDALSVSGKVKNIKPKTSSTKPRSGLSSNEERELQALPAQIEALEGKQTQLSEVVSGAGFYQLPQSEVDATLGQLSDFGEELERCYERWSDLEQKKGA